MESIKKILSVQKVDRKTERGELMLYFLQKINPSRKKSGYVPISFGRMGRVLQGIPTKDLYYLKSVCDDHERRGNVWAKKFWWEIDAKKHV